MPNLHRRYQRDANVFVFARCIRIARGGVYIALIMTTQPQSIRLDACTACQLKCHGCPTARGETARCLGRGALRFEDFKNLIDRNRHIAHVELSNWGEIFLNSDLVRILEYAYRRNVAMSAGNGANLNTVNESQLRAVVKYRLRKMTCSIDGASQATYCQYRVSGDFDTVIDNIRRINWYKAVYRSPYPKLRWQFVVFGHNEHEIAAARAMAAELGMTFGVKLSWADLYDQPEFSPVRDKDLVRRETGAASRAEYRDRHGRDYLYRDICREMWTSPQVNHDGRVLGCSINHWGDYGNAFTSSLEGALDGERMRYARAMLMGDVPPRDDIPCAACKVYRHMVEDRSWITPDEVTPADTTGRVGNMVETKLLGRLRAIKHRVRA